MQGDEGLGAVEIFQRVVDFHLEFDKLVGAGFVRESPLLPSGNVRRLYPQYMHIYMRSHFSFEEWPDLNSLFGCKMI